MRSTLTPLAFAVLLSGLTGCGLVGPDTYELDEKNVQTEVGEEFTLSVPLEISMGEHWGMTSPKPDAAVVRSTREDEEWEDGGDDVGGGGAAKLFDFKAVGKGTTKIRLIQCPNRSCVPGSGDTVVPSPVPSGSPPPNEDYRPTVHTYTVTVK